MYLIQVGSEWMPFKITQKLLSSVKTFCHYPAKK